MRVYGSLVVRISKELNSKFVSPNAVSLSPGKYFTPIVCFLLFNVADFVGRFITHWVLVSAQTLVGAIRPLTMSTHNDLSVCCCRKN